jgi:hypothetical protein
MNRFRFRRPGIGLALDALCGAAAALALSGCVETAADMAPKSEFVATQIVRREGVSIAGASVAFVSIDGPPAPVLDGFSKQLTQEAAARDIVIADRKKARYLIRGYLSAYAVQDGAAVEYVWDVFDQGQRRAQRVNDVLVVKGDGSDPWKIISDAALTSVAAKSADDLAAFLSNTPEAVAVAAKDGAPPAKTTAEAEKPLSYAPVD